MAFWCLLSHIHLVADQKRGHSSARHMSIFLCLWELQMLLPFRPISIFGDETVTNSVFLQARSLRAHCGTSSEYCHSGPHLHSLHFAMTPKFEPHGFSSRFSTQTSSITNGVVFPKTGLCVRYRESWWRLLCKWRKEPIYTLTLFRKWIHHSVSPFFADV